VVIGLGTSAPEFLVSGVAAARGDRSAMTVAPSTPSRSSMAATTGLLAGNFNASMMTVRPVRYQSTSKQEL
jgi:hypothetical protein